MDTRPLMVGIAGLGAIGAPVARALLAGDLPGLTLAAVAARDARKAAERLGAEVRTCTAGDLPLQCDVIVEALPPEAFAEVAEPAIAAGKTLIALSSGALLHRPDLIARAAETGAVIRIPSGAILGLDALKAAAQGDIKSVTLRTRKPPASLKGAPLVAELGLDLDALAAPHRLFEGTVTEAIRHFPANVNVGATIALAGIGPERTRIEVWADPALTRNTHQVQVASAVCNFRVEIESLPSPDNPRTGQATAASTLACLKGLTAPLRVGT